MSLSRLKENTRVYQWKLPATQNLSEIPRKPYQEYCLLFCIRDPFINEKDKPTQKSNK